MQCKFTTDLLFTSYYLTQRSANYSQDRPNGFAKPEQRYITLINLMFV